MAKVAKRRGRYVLDFYDHTGRRQRKALKAGTNLKMAKEKLREIEEQISKGAFIPDKKIPLFSDVAKNWIKHKKNNLRHSTWSVYEGHTKNHFSPLDNLKINRITTAKVEEFIAEKQNAGMHILTLRKILVSLGQIMQYAVRHRYIDYNPVREAEKPRGQGKMKSTDKKIAILNPEQISSFLKSVSDQKYHTLFMLAIMTGARQGEILGLKWHDVDWINNQIRIRRTFNNQRFFDVKTKGSHRNIDIGPNMMTALKKWKLACPPTKLNLVFPNKAGNPINHNNLVNRNFNPALKKAELPKMRFHDLRHTKASIMIEQGENLKYIQSQMGHSSPTVTLNVYAHLMKPSNQEAACRYENMVLNESWSQNGHR